MAYAFCLSAVRKQVSVEAGLRDLDLMTAQLSLSVPVDMMPGSE